MGCNVAGGSNVLQFSVAGAPSYTVPSDGVITGWSHKGRSVSPGSGRLQVWRLVGGTVYTLVGRRNIEPFAASQINNFLTNIPVSAGDVLGFRASTVGTGCIFPTGEALRFDVTTPGDPEPGETRNLSSASFGRVNVSATFDPTDPTPPPRPANIDSSATRGKQSADKLKIKVTRTARLTSAARPRSRSERSAPTQRNRRPSS